MSSHHLQVPEFHDIERRTRLASQISLACQRMGLDIYEMNHCVTVGVSAWNVGLSAASAYEKAIKQAKREIAWRDVPDVKPDPNLPAGYIEYLQAKLNARHQQIQYLKELNRDQGQSLIALKLTCGVAFVALGILVGRLWVMANASI